MASILQLGVRIARPLGRRPSRSQQHQDFAHSQEPATRKHQYFVEPGKENTIMKHSQKRRCLTAYQPTIYRSPGWLNSKVEM